MSRKITFILLIFLIGTNIFAQNMLEGNFSYTGDVVGMSKDSRDRCDYLGKVTAGITLNGKEDFMNNFSLKFSVGNTHGATPSLDFTHDYQVFDNIEADNHTYLEYLYLRYENDKISAQFGVQDINDNFVVSEAADNFINSSFGLNPVISNNFSIPTFPLNGLGLEFGVKITDQWQIQTAVYEGEKLDFPDNEYNLNLNFDNGVLGLLETRYNFDEKSYVLFGGFYQSYYEKGGLYASIQKLFDITPSHSVTPFLNTNVFFSEKPLTNKYHIDGGLVFDGIFSREKNDSLGLAFTLVKLNSIKEIETQYEAYYHYDITDYIYLQPTIEYIVNPIFDVEGVMKSSANAFVYMARLNIEI